jgi:hypothetical protein
MVLQVEMIDDPVGWFFGVAGVLCECGGDALWVLWVRLWVLFVCRFRRFSSGCTARVFKQKTANFLRN